MRLWFAALLAILLVFLLPMWPHAQPWGLGYYPSALLGVILLAMLVGALIAWRRAEH